jgi:nitrogen fixation NifU-like protein
MYSEKVICAFKNPKNIGEIKNPDGIGKVGNPVCLLPTTRIHINNNLKEIKDINKKAKVLSHDGFYSRIIRTYKRNYFGNVIEIKNKLGKTLLTPEHEVLSIKIPKTDHLFRIKNKKKLKYYWYHAEELQKNDLIAYPILKEEKNLDYIAFSQKKKKFDYRGKKIPEKIKINKNFLKLAGYYLAEGNLKNKVTKASVWLERLFKSLFGVGADKKRIPDWMMLLPVEKQKSIIFGLWKGDGYFNERKRAGYSTISYTLAQQIKMLLLRQRIVPSLSVEEEKNVKGVRHRKVYRVHIDDRASLEKLGNILDIKLKINKPITIDSWFDNNYLFIPITQVKKLNYKGYVHNLEIENAKSYTTESLTVHNCGDLMWVYIKVKIENGKEILDDVKIKTFGCVAAIATSSTMTEMVIGKSIEEAERLTNKDVAERLGGLPHIKMHCSNLAADGLKAAIQDYRKKKTQLKK